MADLQILSFPSAAFAVVAFALAVFNFVVSIWSIRNVRALKEKSASKSTAA